MATQSQIIREAKGRIRTACLQASVKREEFAELASEVLKRPIRLPEPKEVHEKLRWLNLHALELKLKLRPRDVVSLLLSIHQNAIRRGSNLGVPPATLLGPASLSRCQELAQELYPEAVSAWANEMRLQELAGSLDDSPLPSGISHIAPEYRRRMREVTRAASRLKLRYRRPFRNNYWQI